MVKCLTCNFKWNSSAKHAFELKDHKEKRWKKLNEAQVLEMIEEGLLYVDTARGQVWKCKSDRCIRLSQLPDRQRGYLFVDVYRFGRRKRAAVHRLVMMATTLQLIPEDREPDHKDKDVTNNSISNLRLLLKEKNRATNVAEVW